jgi:hypothetical protein
VLPTSPGVILYWLGVLPVGVTFEQLAPEESHSCHWKEYVGGSLDFQVPMVALTVPPQLLSALP